MMYSVYRLSDGVVLKHVTCPPDQLRFNVPAGCEAIEGELDARTQRVDAKWKSITEWPAATDDWQRRAEDELARETLARIEAGQVRTIREALLGDAEAVQRLRDQEPAIAAAREVLRRPRASSAPSAPAPAAPAEPPAE